MVMKLFWIYEQCAHKKIPQDSSLAGENPFPLKNKKKLCRIVAGFNNTDDVS
jgi:hypothetical protein